MTTLAVKDGQMAADTQCTGDYVARVQKIHRLPDGTIVGGAGSVGQIYAALAWLKAGRPGEAPVIDDARLLFLRPDLTIAMADGMWPEFELLDGTAAVGSGAVSAMAFMASGSTAVEAVRKTAKLDAYTSDPVQSMRIDAPVRRRRR